MQPSSLARWQYVENNPINNIDPSGYITENEASDAESIIKNLSAFGVTIKKDWGVWFTMSTINPIGTVRCGWADGRWSLVELQLLIRTIGVADLRMQTKFRSLVGPFTIAKVEHTCGRGCTSPSGNLIELLDSGKLPINTDLSQNFRTDRNFDAFTVLHEIGHVWDLHQNGLLSNGLESYTGGYTDPTFEWFWKGHRQVYPDYCADDTYRTLPGCNRAGYFYGGKPLIGSDVNFNKGEDFASSYAVYIFPELAHTVVSVTYPNGPFHWELKDLSDNPRYIYINSLISGSSLP